MRDAKNRRRSAPGLAPALCIASVLLLAGTSTSLALAAPGQLDTSFGAGGKTRADFGGYDIGQAVALQPDGKIVVAGYSNVGGSNDFAVTLLNSQGTFDPSFGAGGKTLADFGGQDLGSAVALQPDGKIVVAGSSDPGGIGNFAVARLLNPQGTFDPSFGAGGKSLVDFGGYKSGHAVALQPDGKIVVAGYSPTPSGGNFAVTRLLNPQGTPDTDFGGGTGRSLGDFGGNDVGNAVALQPDGKIVVAGSSSAGSSNTGRGGGSFDFAVERLLNPSGSFDPSFGAGGKTLADFGGNDFGNAVALQPDGKIVVAGASGGNFGGNFAVARLQPNGLLDSTFGNGGKALVDFGGGDFGRAVALQPDGKIVVAGGSGRNHGGSINFAVARLQPNGLLDSTFGNGGKALANFGGTFGIDIGNAVALQPDGKIVVAGSSDAGANLDQFAVARLQGDPGGPAGPSKCAGKQATILGTAGADKLKGTKKRDVIAGLGGNDVIRGLGGNDRICGGPGKDKLLGGPGKDKLLGQAGKDKLVGGPGKDKLNGGSGKDSARQ